MLTRKGVTTGRTPVLAIPVLTVDAAKLYSITLSNPDTKQNQATIRIAESGTYTILKEILLIAGAKATETIAFPGQPLNTETVTVDGKVYTFQDSLTEVDGNVKIGGTAALSRTNLENALAATAGVIGTDYATAMVAHSSCDGVANGANLDISAKEMGVYGNDIVLAEATTNITITTPLAGGLARQATEFNLPVGISQGQSIEILLARPVVATEWAWSAAYELNP